jgi:hypothetical protein
LQNQRANHRACDANNQKQEMKSPSQRIVIQRSRREEYDEEEEYFGSCSLATLKECFYTVSE